MKMLKAKIGKKGNVLISIDGGQWTPASELKPQLRHTHLHLRGHLIDNAPNITFRSVNAWVQAGDSVVEKPFVASVLVDGLEILKGDVPSTPLEVLKMKAKNFAEDQKTLKNLRYDPEPCLKAAPYLQGSPSWESLRAIGVPLPQWDRRATSWGRYLLVEWLRMNRLRLGGYKLGRCSPPGTPTGLLSQHKYNKILEFVKGAVR